MCFFVLVFASPRCDQTSSSFAGDRDLVFDLSHQTAALKIGEAIYGNKGAAEGDAEGEGAEGADKENVQDAEFEEKAPDGEEKEKKSQ